MNTLLVILLMIAMAAVGYVLVRGVITMAQGKDLTGEQQQHWMRKRIQYQLIAIAIAALLLLLLRGGQG